VRPDVESAPLEVVILGAGFGGLCMAIKLLEAGIRDFAVIS